MMQALLMIVLCALAGPDGSIPPARPSVELTGPRAAVSQNAPLVTFEIREIKVSSPDWRGKLMPRLHEIDRQEGTAVWAVDPAAFKELLETCQGDPRANVVSAPRMTVPVGQPARITNEEAVSYVASLKRHADGAPGQASKLAFEPQVGEIHNGVRVNVLSSQLKGQALFARVVINENRLVKMHTANYSEPVLKKVEVESHEGKGPLHDRLHRSIGLERHAINATIQIPEVETRRAEGEWLIPGEGALVVSMGPKTRVSGLKSEFEEHLIVITARPITSQATRDSAFRKTLAPAQAR